MHNAARGVASRITFMGTGSSTGTPMLRCVMQEGIDCKVCNAAAADPMSVHRRGPPCLLLEVDEGKGRMLIDCGPGFKESAMRFFPKLKVDKLDAVVLTHDHNDALLSLDCLREVQSASCPPGTWTIDTHLPLYGNQKALDTAKIMFPYLFSSEEFKTLAGKLEANLVKHNVPFTPPNFASVPITPLDVEHGKGYISLGFLFGSSEVVAYISDVSCVPNETMEILEAAGVSTLIVDAIAEFERPSHYSVSQALDLIRRLRPSKNAFLVGMSCNIEHHSMNEKLRALTDLPCDVQLAYDGLSLDVML
eukprot:TRINITY_DN4223_c1_g1_i1.p1 TRINITY_DN4223_c1_g1~~TRINITY_DN4223_c1_g1_i1.p1  ORF type:complete len:322 (+),score=62.14 TRINITY_DN4223_c1_g1_i1:50-967(+)